MTTEDDIAKLAELGRALRPPDLDAPTADRIARRARDDVGKGPDPRRYVEPAIAAAFVIAYAVWLILELLKVLR